jgi:hypothetical protein
MNGFVVFLTLHAIRPRGESMRRVLRIRTAFEPTRSSEQQLQLAYERVVETIRRPLTCDGSGPREDRESDGTEWDKARSMSTETTGSHARAILRTCARRGSVSTEAKS